MSGTWLPTKAKPRPSSSSRSRMWASRPHSSLLFQRMGEGQGVEVVGIAQDLDRHLRVLGRQRLTEIGQRLPFPGMQLAFDHVAEGFTAPAFPDCHRQVPVTGLRVFDAVQQEPEMTPRQKRHTLWHYLRVQPRFRQ